MRNPLVLAAALIAACASTAAPPRSPAPPPARTTPPPAASLDEATVRATGLTLAAALSPCDQDKVTALLDRPALRALIEARAPGDDALALVELFVSTGAVKLCAWFDDPVEVRLLRVRDVHGVRQALIRKVSAAGVGYFDVRVSVGPDGPRIVDVYSHNNGTWLDQEIADALLLSGAEDPMVGVTTMQVNALDDAGKPADALAALDTLPEATRNTRAIQSWRVAIAGRISPTAYAQAAAERARRFPDDKPTPFAAMNRAFMRADFDEALHQLDLMDAEIGGDPLLDALRAGVIAQRNHPGDRAIAAALAAHAVVAEPELAMSHAVQLGIALAQGQWATAVTALDDLARQVGFTVPEATLSKMPNAASFLATPEYQAWRARHP
ncbi:MAG: hypothetical protein K8W52_04290 [Deltaproteobacteria bacterium]|nr:hypothetical protein [Deltaproteobacteria bacterium]